MNEQRFFSLAQQDNILFTPEQHRAIVHGDGPMIVFAGPGSGKTTVITWRALYLYQVLGIDPKQMVIFTFTRRSAKELKQRLTQREPRLGTVVAGTFHSLFLRWLLRYDDANFQIWNESSQMTALREVLRAESMPSFDDSVHRYMQYITQLKNADIMPEQMQVKDPLHQDIKKVYSGYESRKKQVHAHDYDDLLLVFYHKMEKAPSFLQAVLSSFTHMMVDEFQDTSKIQWLSIKAMTNRSKNIVVVGDDDQSIYRFRGALPHSVSDFLGAFKSCSEVILHHNFRSTDEIIRTASSVITHNSARKQKEFIGTRGSGVKIRYFSFLSEWDEAKHIATLVHRVADKQPKTSIAVLARTNRQLTPIVDALFDHQLMFSLGDVRSDMYRDRYVQVVLSLLRAANSAIEKDRVQAWRAYHHRMKARMNHDKMMESFYRLLEETGKMLPSDAFAHLRRALLFTGPTKADLWAMLDLVQERSAKQTDTFAWLQEINQHEQHLQEHAIRRVLVTTFHGAKGLEFDDVFLIGLHDEALPHRRTLEETSRKRLTEALEEERRLLYVGMTRAKSRLYCSYPRIVAKEKVSLSPFLQEIGVKINQAPSRIPVRPAAQSIAAPHVGSPCRHKIFGQGVIVSVDIMEDKAHKVGILFSKNDMRYFHWETVMQFDHVIIEHEEIKGIEL